MSETITLRCELLRDIRHPKSQSWLSARLNVSKTQVHRWESGINRIKWQTFVRICQIRHRKIADAINNVTAGKPIPDKSPVSIIKLLAAQMKIGEIAECLGCSRFTVSRWFNSKTEPDLDDVLSAFLKMKPLLLRPFLSPIVSKTFEEKNEKLFFYAKVEVDLTYEYPVIALILRCLEIKEYLDADEHLDGYISRKAGISFSDEKALLNTLKGAGLVAFDGSKYAVVNTQLDIRGNFKGTLRTRKYWMERAIQFVDQLEVPPQDAMFSSNVFSVSREAYSKIRELYLTFYEEVRSTVAHDKKAAEIAAVLSMQIFDPSELIS